MTESKQAPPDPMAVWSAVCQTDPAHTKTVSFGRKFTAISPTSQSLAATRLWGPEGGAWGVENVRYERETFDDGSVLAVCTIDLRHPQGVVQAVRAAEEYYVKGKKGWRLDVDAWKKVRTSARSKALSQLGFNADVFLGGFDDQAYVRHRTEEVQREKQRAQQAAQAKPPQKEAPPSRAPEIVDRILGNARALPTETQLQIEGWLKGLEGDGWPDERLGKLFHYVQNLALEAEAKRAHSAEGEALDATGVVS